jgi:hypothetical protein
MRLAPSTTLSFTTAAKKHFKASAKRLSQKGMIASLSTAKGTAFGAADSGTYDFYFAGNLLPVGGYHEKDRPADSIMMMFGCRVSILPETIRGLRGHVIDLVHVVDCRTGREQPMLRAIRAG